MKLCVQQNSRSLATQGTLPEQSRAPCMLLLPVPAPRGLGSRVPPDSTLPWLLRTAWCSISRGHRGSPTSTPKYSAAIISGERSVAISSGIQPYPSFIFRADPPKMVLVWVLNKVAWRCCLQPVTPLVGSPHGSRDLAHGCIKSSPHVVFCTQNSGNKLALKRAQCSRADVL